MYKVDDKRIRKNCTIFIDVIALNFSVCTLCDNTAYFVYDYGFVYD